MKKSSDRDKYPNNLRALRKVAGLKQHHIAETLGDSDTVNVSRKENGIHAINPDELDKLEKKYGWSASQIYGKNEIHHSSERTIVSMELDAARGQLDSAIELWFNNGNKASIHTLAVAAYKGMRPTEKDKDLEYQPPEGMILSCIMKLQSAGDILNQLETSFILWLSVDEPKLFKDEFREFCHQHLFANGLSNIAKPDKSEFFRAIVAGSRKEV